MTCFCFIIKYLCKFGIYVIFYLCNIYKEFEWMYALNGAIYIMMQEKTYSEISKMNSYWNYSKLTICRYMKKNIGDFVLTKELIREGHQNFLFVKILYDKTSTCKKSRKKFCWKNVMAKAVIPASISKRQVIGFHWRLT